MIPSIKCATIYDLISIVNSIKFKDPIWCPLSRVGVMTYRLLSTKPLCKSMSSKGYSGPNKLTSMKYEQNTVVFIQENAYLSVVCKLLPVLFQCHCVQSTLYRNRAICYWSRHNKPVITELIYQALSVYNTNVYVPSSIWCKVIYHSHIQIYFPTSCLSNSTIFQSIADVNDVIFILF